MIFHDFVNLFDTFVRLFVGLWQSRIIFSPMKKYSHVSIYASRGGSWEKSSNDARLIVITLNVVLVRTASQSQRGGSIISMKGTGRDRSKAGINKGV